MDLTWWKCPECGLVNRRFGGEFEARHLLIGGPIHALCDRCDVFVDITLVGELKVAPHPQKFDPPTRVTDPEKWADFLNEASSDPEALAFFRKIIGKKMYFEPTRE